jgi:hypothetical protein
MPHATYPGAGAGRAFVRRCARTPLFGLAPSGVYPAIDVAIDAVRSYRTISPLPRARPKTAPGRYIFCGTFRRLAPPRCYLAPCPAEPGLSSAPLAAYGDCLVSSPRQVWGRARDAASCCIEISSEDGALAPCGRLFYRPCRPMKRSR